MSRAHLELMSKPRLIQIVKAAEAHAAAAIAEADERARRAEEIAAQAAGRELRRERNRIAAARRRARLVKAANAQRLAEQLEAARIEFANTPPDPEAANHYRILAEAIKETNR